MRFPTHNICRAFPELDGFSDEQCKRFLQATLKKHWLARLLLNLLVVVLFNVGWYGLAYSVFILMLALGIKPGGDSGFGVAILAVVIGALAGALTGLLIRDRWLRRRLSARILELACAGCGYSLLGLAAQQGIIICPECGNRCELASRGIEVDTTLITPEATPTGTP